MQSQVKRGSNEVYNFGIHIIFVEYVRFVENLQTLQQQKKGGIQPFGLQAPT